MSDLTGSSGKDVGPGDTGPEATKYVLGPDGQPLIGSDGTPIVDRRRPTNERRPSNPRVSVVVPAKNEAPNIREILPYLKEFHEVIVVVSEDDHESAEAARAALPSAAPLARRSPRRGRRLRQSNDAE